MRFQVGDQEQALLEVEDESVAVGLGNAPVRAALAVMLHALRPRQLLRAEAEWEAAVELAPNFENEARARQAAASAAQQQQQPRQPRQRLVGRRRRRRGWRRSSAGHPPCWAHFTPS